MPRLFWYWIQFNTKPSNVDIQTDHLRFLHHYMGLFILLLLSIYLFTCLYGIVASDEKRDGLGT